MLPPLAAEDSNGDEKESRPDLIYVSIVPRKGLFFRFIEVKYRRHLRAARNPEVLQEIREQVESLRKRWDEWYCQADACSSFRAIRRAKLARVLRFYADKARRHADDERKKGLSAETYMAITSEIDRMIEKGEAIFLPGRRTATADGCSARNTLAPARWRSLLPAGIRGYSCSVRACCPIRIFAASLSPLQVEEGGLMVLRHRRRMRGQEPDGSLDSGETGGCGVAASRVS